MTPPAKRQYFRWCAFVSALFASAALTVVVTVGKDDAENDGDRAADAAARVKPELEKTLEEKGLRFGAPIFVRIFKESSELEVWIQKEKQPDTEASEPQFELLRIYKICKWSGDLGPKEKQGDGQAPEGFYHVNRGRMNPNSRFHLSFDLGYPNAYDRVHKRTGDYLMVHGSCVSIGCYAMTDQRIEEIYALGDAALAGGQKYFRVHCFPFRMTDERMAKATTAAAQRPESEQADAAELLSFWENLREGYEWFEKNKQVPNVEVKDGRYVLEESGSANQICRHTGDAHKDRSEKPPHVLNSLNTVRFHGTRTAIPIQIYDKVREVLKRKANDWPEHNRSTRVEIQLRGAKQLPMSHGAGVFHSCTRRGICFA